MRIPFLNKYSLSALLAILLLLSPFANAKNKVVWQIGTFDQSPEEFRMSRPRRMAQQPATPVIYVIGKSIAATDWPGYQPASTLDAAGKPRRTPYTIQFELSGPPEGVYLLKVGLLSRSARVAQLRVDINGHVGSFFQYPKLNYEAGEWAGPAGVIAFDFPAAFLQKGTNKLALSAVYNTPAVGNERSNAFIAYDAIALEQNTAGKLPGVSAEVQPTIFYVRSGDGLAELVDVTVRHTTAVKAGQVTLALGKDKRSHDLTAQEFGEQRLEFKVPEFPAETKAEVVVKINGHAQRFPEALTPAKKWKLMTVPHVHVDVGYTDYQEKVAEIQSRELDEAIDLIEHHPEFRFSTDGFWSARQFMAARSEKQRQQLSEMIRAKKIFTPTVEASLLTGFPAVETLIRSLYPAYQFHQRVGADSDYVNITDVPSYTWSYPSVLAAAGIKYMAAGCDNDNGPILLNSHLNEKSPFWWEGPDGGKVLLWYSWGYAQFSQLFGGLEGDMAAGHDHIPIFLQAYSHPDYKSDAVVIYGSQGENTDLFPEQASMAEQWNKVYAYPHLQYSGFADAISYITGQFGDAIPVVRGDGGPYWEDGIVSTTRSAVIDREAEQRGLAAEKFSTITSLINPRIRPETDALKRMWNNMVLYDEHTWGDSRSVSDPESQETLNQLAVKEAFATDAQRDASLVLRRALASLADSIYDPKGTLLVFNPLSWQRSGLVEFDLDKGLDLVDKISGKPVPYEVVSAGPSYHHIRFVAQDVPSVGYKAYELRQTGEEPPDPAATSGQTIENQYYRLELDPESGAIRSIFDKELNKELVESGSPYRFDQYLYVTGGDEAPNRLTHYNPAWPVPELTVHSAGGGRLVSITKQPFGTVARLESTGVNTPRIETEVILFDAQKKIELINHVNKKQVYTKEGVYFAFPFAMNQPRYRYEIQNGVVDPARDQMPGAGKEWFSVQHWIAADQDGVTVAIVPVDAFLVTLGDICRGTWPKEFGKRNGRIFSYLMNNYYYTNYAAGQGGDFTFRYVLTSGNDLTPAALSKLGWEEMSPLEKDHITSQDKAVNSPRPLPADRNSFLRVSQADVVLVTWKVAEDGAGTVMRFLATGENQETVEVQAPLLAVQSAWTSDALERRQDAVPVSTHGFRFAIKPHQIVTIRLEASASVN